jgi:uncharacterized protein
MNSPVRIGDTCVGRGVFARHEIAARTVIGQVRGALIRDRLYESDYCMTIDDDRVLEPNSPYCYLNHRCEPNCAWFISDDQSTSDDPEANDDQTDPIIWLYAIRAIAAGDELTIDYNWPADSAIPCHCGSDNCRGWVVAEDELADIPV